MTLGEISRKFDESFSLDFMAQLPWESMRGIMGHWAAVRHAALEEHDEDLEFTSSRNTTQAGTKTYQAYIEMLLWAETQRQLADTVPSLKQPPAELVAWAKTQVELAQQQWSDRCIAAQTAGRKRTHPPAIIN